MRPTIYLPFADLRPTGLRRASASSVARSSADRIATRRLRTETEGRQAGMTDQAKQGAGGPGEERTP